MRRAGVVWRVPGCTNPVPHQRPLLRASPFARAARSTPFQPGLEGGAKEMSQGRQARRGLRLGLLVLGWGLLLPGLVSAKEVFSDILAKGSSVNFDGLLDEWVGLPGQEVPIIERVSYKGASDLSVMVQSLHDEETIYFAITVTDDQFIRTGAGTVGEDKVMLWFGSEPSGVQKPLALSFLPGDLLSIKQDLRFGGKKVPSSSAGRREIEALESFVPKEGRWMVELSIPWSKLPSSLRGRERIPFCLAVFDGDEKGRPRTEAVASTCPLSKGSPSTLDWLVFQERAQILDGFLRDVGYSRADILKEFYADLGGDKEIDRLVIVGQHVVLLGTGLGENFYYYYRLGIRSANDLKEVRLMDVDMDGKENLVIRSVEYDSSQQYSQEILRVFALSKGLFAPIFGQEIAGSQREGSLTSKIEWKKKGKGYELTIFQASSQGVTAENYVDIDARDERDYHEILLPWGGEKKITYRFASGKAEVIK